MLTFFRSRMFSPAFRLFAGISIVTFLGAVIFAIGTNGNSWTFDGTFPFVHVQSAVDSFLGPVTLGWKGPVGNHGGFVLLLSMSGVAAFLAGMLVIFRDADPESEAQAAQLDTVPLTRAPAGRSYWPILLAFDMALIMVGLAVNVRYMVLGFFLLGVIGAAWTFQNWAFRATGDDEVNRELYGRFVDPMRIPVVGVIVLAIVVLGFSRVLLAAPDATTSVAVFGGVGAVLFVVLVAVAYVKKMSRNMLAALLVIGALAFIVAGIVGAVMGERESESKSSSEGSLGPVSVQDRPPDGVRNA